jgi:hypothetical protein
MAILSIVIGVGDFGETEILRRLGQLVSPETPRTLPGKTILFGATVKGPDNRAGAARGDVTNSTERAIAKQIGCIRQIRPSMSFLLTW